MSEETTAALAVATDSVTKKDTQSTIKIDPEFDITSEKFNPLKVLTSVKAYIPIKNAPIYNNFAAFESAMKKQESQLNVNAATSTSAGKSNEEATLSSSKMTDSELTTLTRRFLPHQGLVKGGPKLKSSRNVLLKMENDIQGPLKQLQTWKNTRKRVKVYTRNEKTTDGYVTGFVEVFDKHWNIALSDVHQTWKRKKLHHCETAVMADSDCADEIRTMECLQRLSELQIEVPAISVKSINRKFAECSRRVPQLLIRGEQVALVTLDFDAIPTK